MRLPTDAPLMIYDMIAAPPIQALSSHSVAF